MITLLSLPLHILEDSIIEPLCRIPRIASWSDHHDTSALSNAHSLALVGNATLLVLARRALFRNSIVRKGRTSTWLEALDRDDAREMVRSLSLPEDVRPMQLTMALERCTDLRTLRVGNSRVWTRAAIDALSHLDLRDLTLSSYGEEEATGVANVSFARAMHPVLLAAGSQLTRFAIEGHYKETRRFADDLPELLRNVRSLRLANVLLDDSPSFIRAIPIELEHLEFATDSYTDRVSAFQDLDDILLRTRRSLRTLEIVIPPSWTAWAHDYMPDGIGYAEKLEELTILGGHWTSDDRRFKLPATLRRLRLLHCVGITGLVQHWLRDLPAGLEFIEITLLDAIDDPARDEIIKMLEGVQIAPDFLQGPSIVGKRPAWTTTRYRWARSIR